MLQILLERLDFGKTLPRGDRRAAREPAQHRDDAGRAGVHRLAGAGARRRRTGTRSQAPAHTSPTNGEIGAATGIEFLPGGAELAAAAEPVRRGGGAAAGGQPVAAQSASTGSAARAPSTTASASASASARERAGGDRDHAHAVGARAGDVARRVADHDRALARPAAGARARDRGQLAALLGVGAEAALAAREVVRRCPAAASLRRAIGSRLPVTSASR